MKKVFIFLVLNISIFNSYAQQIINPVTNVNWACIFPITIGSVPMGTSGNPLADVTDVTRSETAGAACYCPILKIGIPLGMSRPNWIAESTTEAFRSPSFGMSLSSGTSEYFLKGGSDVSTKEGSKTAYVHTHIHKFSILQLVDIFTDGLCLSETSTPLDTLYLSEVDPVANSSSLSTMIFPEAVLAANPLVAMSCSADAIAASAGGSIDLMFWCFGGNLAFPASNHTIESGSFESASSISLAKTMMRYQRYTKGIAFPLKTGLPHVQLCGQDMPSLLLIKSQYRFQPAYPVFGRCSRIGEASLLWNTPKRSMPNGDLVHILWEREDCCALPVGL